MLLGEILRVAMGALRANKLRSFLTMLGIVIGVAAVIAMIALGRGAQKAVNERISALGTTLLTVTPGQIFGRGVAAEADRARLTMDDADALSDSGGYVVAVRPEMSRQLQVQYLNRNTNTQVVGTTANYLDVRKYELQAGRMFTRGEDESRRRVAVLGPEVAKNLGFLASNGPPSPWNNPDDQVLSPIQTARCRVLGSDRVRSISVLARSERDIPETMASIQRVLRREHRLRPERPDDFTIRNQADFLNTLGETTQVFSLLLAGIAAVSLLVGGIGIMNIMLVSVTERTREIGIRKALGASRRTILLQFLIEAEVLCFR